MGTDLYGLVPYGDFRAASRAVGSSQRAPNLTPVVPMLLGFWSLFLSAHDIQRVAVILRPSTLLGFHDTLKKRKYRLLHTARSEGNPVPKGPSHELIDAIVEMKRRNSWFVCPRIAQEINKAFGLNIDKDVVRRTLEKHYRPDPIPVTAHRWRARSDFYPQLS